MPQPSADSSTDLHQQMTEMMFGYCVSQIIRTAAEFSLADRLAAGPLTAEEIAERKHSAPATTFRLMRACVAFGLVTTDDAGRFGGTALLGTPRTDAPRSLRALVMAATNSPARLPRVRFCASGGPGPSHGHNPPGQAP